MLQAVTTTQAYWAKRKSFRDGSGLTTKTWNTSALS